MSYKVTIKGAAVASGLSHKEACQMAAALQAEGHNYVDFRLDLSPEQKRALYAAGHYSVPVPGVTPQCWSDNDWINFVDSHGRWHVSKLGEVTND